MKTSEILRRTKKVLSKTDLHGICIAMWNVPHLACADVRRVQEMIYSRICGKGYATNWLAHEVLFGNKRKLPNKWRFKRNQWLDEQKPEELQAWRHRWVDSMIAEFKSKGD